MAHNYETCKFRAHYDKKPDSLLGKFWRWHINFCLSTKPQHGIYIHRGKKIYIR